jgi:hypothetical protein
MPREHGISTTAPANVAHAKFTSGGEWNEAVAYDLSREWVGVYQSQTTPSPSMGQGRGEGDGVPIEVRPLTLTLSRKGRGNFPVAIELTACKSQTTSDQIARHPRDPASACGKSKPSSLGDMPTVRRGHVDFNRGANHAAIQADKISGRTPSDFFVVLHAHAGPWAWHPAPDTFWAGWQIGCGRPKRATTQSGRSGTMTGTNPSRAVGNRYDRNQTKTPLVQVFDSRFIADNGNSCIDGRLVDRPSAIDRTYPSASAASTRLFGRIEPIQG